jgi:hypothetical protein
LFYGCLILSADNLKKLLTHAHDCDLILSLAEQTQQREAKPGSRAGAVGGRQQTNNKAA